MKIAGIFLLWCLAGVKSLEIGDACDLPTGYKGECIKIHDCAYAKELLKKNENPGYCGFVGKDPLVCCIEVTPKISGKPGELSATKCQEYYPYKKYFLVVGAGRPSLAKEFPHMAIIGFGDSSAIQWLCGGSLISHNFILTAAHCLKSAQFGEVKFVRLGDLDIANETDVAGPQDFTVKRTFAHPDYRRPSRYHDIGLIELDRKVKLTEFVAIACLDTHREHNETHMTVTGWGKTEFLGTPSSHLLKADFDVIPHSACRLAYQRSADSVLPLGIVDDGQICAGGSREQDTCEGDSGGPLQVISRERSSSIVVYDIVGVTSFGKACGISDSPGVYTRVYNYLSWIESIVWPSS